MIYQYVPHKAVAEVSKITNYRRLVAVNHASQSKSTDGSKSGWRQRSVLVVVLVIVVAVVVVVRCSVVVVILCYCCVFGCYCGCSCSCCSLK